jgi:hypothetical protein
MEAEPSKADLPKRKRSRFQFRLRTLLIALLALVICGYIGWQEKIVVQRQAMVRHITLDDKGFCLFGVVPPEKELNWIRRFLGDQRSDQVLLPPETSKEERDRIRTVLPEASFQQIVERGSDGSPSKFKPFDD